MRGLNCKPGDLAVIVRDENNQSNVGRIVEVLRPSSFIANAWVVRTRGGALLNSAGDPYKTPAADDECLRPIRPQSDGAVDEMVKLVGIAPMTAAEVLAWSDV